MTAVLRLEGLRIGYRQRRHADVVLAEGIDAEVREGELICLLGPNGAGKSTLMSTICGVRAPLAGRALLMGDDVRQLSPREIARRLAAVLTDRVDADMLSVYALVALGRQPHTDWTGRLSPHDHRVIEDALAATGAGELANRNVAELSDGERQRVMVARALAQEPTLLLLDEITAFLDLPRRVQVMRLLRHVARAARRAVLLSTHDLDLALRTADRVWLLPKGGPLIVGEPATLAASGAFAHAFASEGVDLDEFMTVPVSAAAVSAP